MAVMHQVVDTYEKWCLRLPTARVNHWLRKVSSSGRVSCNFICGQAPATVRSVFMYPNNAEFEIDCIYTSQVMSRHSWKDQAAQPKIKYFTQVKARPPTFVAFLSGRTQLSDTDLRFLTRSLKEDFDLGGIPIRIMQRSVSGKDGSIRGSNRQSSNRVIRRIFSDKRAVQSVEEAADVC